MQGRNTKMISKRRRLDDLVREGWRDGGMEGWRDEDEG